MRARSIPRIKVDKKTGRATLSGIAYQDLQAILTAAANQTELSLQSAKSQQVGSYDAVQVLLVRKRLLDFTWMVMRQATEEINPSPFKKPTRAERLSKIKEAKRVERRIA